MDYLSAQADPTTPPPPEPCKRVVARAAGVLSHEVTSEQWPSAAPAHDRVAVHPQGGHSDAAYRNHHKNQLTLKNESNQIKILFTIRSSILTKLF